MLREGVFHAVAKTMFGTGMYVGPWNLLQWPCRLDLANVFIKSESSLESYVSCLSAAG